MKQHLFLWILSLSISFISCTDDTIEPSSEITKISLRNTGHELLLSHKDSTSRVLPVLEIEPSIKYQISFEKELAFEPSNLVSIIDNNFLKAELPKKYIVEVIDCSINEVAYSYEMKYNKQKAIIPCAGRTLPKGCYKIEVQFLKSSKISLPLYLLVFATIAIALIILFKRKKTSAIKSKNEDTFIRLGKFKFYSRESKLSIANEEIHLSKKECELLEIFTTHLNEVIKRDTLTKRIWEDNGVIVGRSLDTYVSKLRKKLNRDTSIKITNVHGVGYKLEVN